MKLQINELCKKCQNSCKIQTPPSAILHCRKFKKKEEQEVKEEKNNEKDVYSKRSK